MTWLRGRAHSELGAPLHQLSKPQPRFSVQSQSPSGDSGRMYGKGRVHALSPGSTRFSHLADPPVCFWATGQWKRSPGQTSPASSDVSTRDKGTQSRLLLSPVNTELVVTTQPGWSWGQKPLAASPAVPTGLVATFLGISPTSLQRLLTSPWQPCQLSC